MEDSGEKIGDIRSRIPNVAPLAPAMWLEFGGLAKGAGKPATNRYGCLISVELDQKHHFDMLGINDIPENIQWMFRTQCFAKLSNELSVMKWAHYIGVTDEGIITYLARTWSNGSEQPTIKADLYNETIVALLAICFAHCKGTEIKEHQPSRQVSRASERAGKPVFTFHTIDINPSANVLRAEGNVSENGLAKALHICRGHFAHYTTEKPLFGKYTGTFYRPMHVRGNAEKGIAAKDYRVHHPIT